MDSNAVIDIDFDGLKPWIYEKGCVSCDLHERRDNGTRCSGCRFKFSSPTGDPPLARYAIIKRSEREYGVPDSWNIGKHHAFFFVYHRQFNYKFPEVPYEDLRGMVNDTESLSDETRRILTESDKLRHLIWAVHHINGNHNDDRIENLALILGSEHTYLHQLSGQEKEDFIQQVKDRNRRLFGSPCWGIEE